MQNKNQKIVFKRNNPKLLQLLRLFCAAKAGEHALELKRRESKDSRDDTALKRFI